MRMRGLSLPCPRLAHSPSLDQGEENPEKGYNDHPQQRMARQPLMPLLANAACNGPKPNRPSMEDT